MSQTNRHLSRSGVEKKKSGAGVSAPSMAQILEDIFLTQKPTGNCGEDRLAHGTEQSTYGCGRAASDMEKRCSQTAAAAQEELGAESLAGDCRTFPACAVISDTARELCKAVSVSLGLAMDTADTDPALPACSANERTRAECLLGVPAAPDQFPGARSADAAEYRDERLQPGQKQPVELFKSSGGAAPLQHRASTQAPADDRKFALCKADDLATEEFGHLDSVRAASCSYAHSAQLNVALFGQVSERPCRVYKPPAEARDAAESAERKFGGYEPEHYGVKIKSEVPGSAGVLLGSNYAFNDKYSSEFWDGRQCVSAHSNGASSALCNPYERSVVRHEQWFYGGLAKNPYPNSSYMKSEVTYSDPR